MVEEARTHDPPDPHRVLSCRELEVLEMTALGLTNAQVAARLNVTVHAVKFHLASIYRELGVANRTEAAVALLRAGPAARIDGRPEPRSSESAG